MDEEQMQSALADISTGLGFEGGDDDGASGVDGVPHGDGDSGDAAGGRGAAGAADLNGNGVDKGAAGAEPGDQAAGDGTPDGGDGLAANNPDGTPAGVTPAPGPDTPPKSWRPEAAAKWAALDPAIRAEVLKREDDFFKGIEGYKADANFGRSIKPALDPYMPVLQHYNIDPAQQVAGLMKAHYSLAFGTAEDRVNLFRQLAADYKVDLNQVAQEPAYEDPAVKALREQLQGLQSTLSATQQRNLEITQREQRAAIDRFAADPKNVYFNDVANDMAEFIERGVCKTLEEAYEKAVWANPNTRAKELQRQQREAEAKRTEQAKAKAAAVAKATSVNVRSSAKSRGATAPLGSIDDTIDAEFRAIQSRG